MTCHINRLNKDRTLHVFIEYLDRLLFHVELDEHL